MPRNKFQRSIFALMTVFVTVHAYVFYSLYVVNGNTLMSLNNAAGVLEATRIQGGVYMFGTYMPIWAVINIEFFFAYTLEMIVGSPCSFKLTCRIFRPEETHPVLFETAIICSTVALMCPAMSLIASVIYYPYYSDFNILTLAANWVRLVCFNFPFAFFTQLFFIQPLIRKSFKFIFRKDIENRKEAAF